MTVGANRRTEHKIKLSVVWPTVGALPDGLRGRARVLRLGGCKGDILRGVPSGGGVGG